MVWYDMSLPLITLRENQCSVFNFGLVKVLMPSVFRNLYLILRLLRELGKGEDYYLHLKSLQLRTYIENNFYYLFSFFISVTRFASRYNIIISLFVLVVN